KTGDRRIRALLPPGTQVFDKTGTAGRSANDVGLVRLPDGRELAIAIFVKSSTKPQEAREKTIAAIARAAYHGFVNPPAPSPLAPPTRARGAARGWCDTGGAPSPPCPGAP